MRSSGAANPAGGAAERHDSDEYGQGRSSLLACTRHGRLQPAVPLLVHAMRGR